MTSTQRDIEVRSLDDEQHARYDEAQRCGASHDDAMEAALCYGPPAAPKRNSPEITKPARDLAVGDVMIGGQTVKSVERSETGNVLARFDDGQTNG